MNKIANMNEEIELPDKITPQLKDFLSKCFQKEPIKRATAAQLLVHPWLMQMNSSVEIKVYLSIGNVKSKLT